MTSIKKLADFMFLILLLAFARSTKAEPGWVTLHGHAPAVVARLTPKGRLSATNNLHLAIGLPLRNQAALDGLLRELYDPHSTNFHKFLSTSEFTARFGPTAQEYQAVVKFAEASGLAVSGTHPNRVVVDVEGSASNVERAFHVSLRTYKHPAEARDFFAPDAEPSVPANLSVVTVEGLSDYGLPKPLSHRIDPLKIQPLGGSGPGGYYAGKDFRNAYVPGSALNGAGQVVGLLEFSAYYPADITAYENTIGLTNYVPLTTVVIGHPGPTTANNAEVALDIEVAIAMAPGLSQVIVYEIRSGPSSIMSRMANDNLAKQLSSSWTWSGGPSATVDNILQQMAAQGQSFFQASGDSDAYTGAQTLDNPFQTTAPVDSTNLTCVGGTTLAMNGSGVSWSSETVWNYNSLGGNNANVGSGGGISAYYPIPYWQTNVSMAANSGSTTFRNVPDVALTADSVYVAYNNGSSGGVAGTSCAAPLWAGFCALVNQQSVAASGTTVGFLNPALYAIASSSNYANCFHDVTTGNNIGVNTPGLFNAVAAYDLCTGLGTPNGTNLINALTPYLLPHFLTQPASQTVTNGASVTFSATVAGRSPLNYRWLFNGANLPNGGNISGATSNMLSIVAAAPNNSGSYQIIATNNYGSVTSSIALLTVGSAPAFSAQPTNRTILSGGNAVFSATVSGSTPLIYQWRKNGTNLVNGGGISGATSNSLTLASVTTNSSGNYNLFVTNNFGVSTSSVATLTVVLPPAIVASPANQTIECGSNVTFNVTASGTTPLNFLWSLDGTPISGATNTSLSLTNVHLPSHTVTLIVTNLYGSATSNAALTVHDTKAPGITLNGSNPLFTEVGAVFVDPGATANDTCAGSVSVVASGAVDTNALGTNTLTYAANDGSGNTSIATRTVIVRDTTAPSIVWSFTNVTLAADTNCSAPMPDVTGTNFILATDLSGALTISQSPTDNVALPLGTNLVVITARDVSGNAAYSTNTVIIRDETPPMISTQPQSQSHLVGTAADFIVGATACTPLVYQWVFNNTVLADQTNSTFTIGSVSAANAGDYSVVATASGGSSTSVVGTLTVNLISTSLALSSSANPSGYKDNLNFTAVISPANASGTIQFLTNGTLFDSGTLIAGQTTSPDLSLPRGTNLITAIYSGDANDSPVTNTLAQIVTNHPPVAVAVFYNRTAGRSLRIAIADLATNWTDVDDDPISLTHFSVSTQGITLSNDAGSLVYFNPQDVADEFICSISDGWGGANSHTVKIAITPPVDSASIITSIAGNADGSYTLNFAGGSGYTYLLEATTNLNSLESWLPVTTNTFGANGLWQFNDEQTTNFQQRFYRLKLVP